MNSIPIIHVYGKISNLPYNKSEDGFRLGAQINYDELNKIRSNIRTISEIELSNIIMDPIYDSTTEIISEAKRIFFLGFGFDRLNLTSTGIPKSLHPGQKIYGTVYGCNDRFVKETKEYLIQGNLESQKKKGLLITNPISHRDIIFENVDSLSLLGKYL